MKASENLEWLGNLKKRGFTADSVYDKGQHEDLKAKLLAIGGVAVVLPRVEHDKDAIIGRGYSIRLPQIVMEKGDLGSYFLHLA